ncbi:hypothetical protein [Mesorhizobium sp.]|uniref:hypothetical protein n=1 Tax=Mesorhizobium TaxID=68287 RepID=UPI000FE7D243|nr:hypothetical protein [Mesorhizobium sp.]RWQ18144.1 MAG: hypothetical protein EOS19_32930 [Mesorhizobium sp.]
MTTRTALAAARAIFICVLALAVLGLRPPAAEHSSFVQVDVSAHHDHHGHSHEDEDEPSAAPAGHDHDRFHVGDHSHDMPSAAVLLAFGFASPKDSGVGMVEARVASRATPPGDRPPRQA